VKLRIDYVSTGLMKPHAHGYHDKDLFVFHETVSADKPGTGDILDIERYLAAKDYGIHGMTDAEGHIAWALGLGRAIFWQCGGVNERSVGLEQVSKVMLDYPSNTLRSHAWALRQPQLRASAQVLAAWHNGNPNKHPLVYSDGKHPGVTTHWSVSQWSKSSEGHTDCHPKHLGGYYPALEVINMAKAYAKTGLRFPTLGIDL
jgi:hypothetical protein